MERRLINGKPAWKYWSELRAKSIAKKPLKRSWIKQTYKPKVSRPGLQEWYFEKIAECVWVCEECGDSTYSDSADYQIAAQAHLLPKEYFKSVMTHPANHKCLGSKCGCHRRYDKSWESAQKMKVWPSAKQIIITVLIPLLTKTEFRRLPDAIKDEYYSAQSNV